MNAFSRRLLLNLAVQTEEFPLVTLKKLRKHVEEAQQEDEIFEQQQQVNCSCCCFCLRHHVQTACEANVEKFREGEQKALSLVKQAKDVLMQSQEQKRIASSSWKTSRFAPSQSAR